MVYRQDAAALVSWLNERWPDDALQLIGDGLVQALSADVDGAEGLAQRCVAELRERDWEGDRELAESLEARLGTGPIPALRRLPVDLEDLSMQLEGDPYQGDGRIDLTTGEVWSSASIEYGVEVGEIDPDDDDPDRWLWVPRVGSRDGYRDMERFLAALEDERLAHRLERAIVGRGAFRRFKMVLAESPAELERWYAFSDERQRGRTRSWLAQAGYSPSYS